MRWVRPRAGAELKQRHATGVPGIALSQLAQALRPGLLVIGDIHDPETALGTLECVESGMLVFAAMHAPSVEQALRELDAMLAETGAARTRARLAQALRAALGQQLLPRHYGSGRVPVLEILTASERARHQVEQGDFTALAHTMAEGRGLGMTTTDQSLSQLVAAKEIAPEEARMHATDKSLFEARTAGAR